MIKKLIWIISIIFLAGCAKTIPAVKIAEELMVQGNGRSGKTFRQLSTSGTPG
jgi:hypothetical protein